METYTTRHKTPKPLQIKAPPIMETLITANGRKFERVAWTGGDTPPRRYRNGDYRALRRVFFRECVAICGGLNFWECAGTTALDRARIFWNQSRLDAWRTVQRGGPRQFTPAGRLTAYGFMIGGVERRGKTVTVARENGAYMVRRHPDDAAGWLVRSCRTLTEARRMAAAMTRGETPERRDY